MPDVLRQTLAVVAKDLRREWRSREILTTTVSFAVLLMVVFTFAFYRDERTASLVFPGILWVSVVFTGTLAISRTFQHESRAGCLRALALIPGSHRSLYLGKLAVNLIYMALFELALVPLLLVVFPVEIAAGLGPLVATLVAGTIGFAALGTVVCAMLVRNELREVLLPIVLYPLLVPLLIAGVFVTAQLLDGANGKEIFPYLQAMLAMDALYLALGLFLFRWVLSAVE